MLIEANKNYKMIIRNMYGKGEVETQEFEHLSGKKAFEIISKVLEIDTLEGINFEKDIIYVSVLKENETEYTRISITEETKYE